MPPGPFLIFDKSALQSFSVDESNWLDNFFGNVITPLFFTETLADLEKEVGKGRTPEQVVGSLAIRTPDMGATACAHHRIILSSALSGHDVPLMVIIPRTQGKTVEIDGKKGVFFKKSPEEEALSRWYNHEFLDVERQIAKTWRRELSGIDHGETYQFFQSWFLLGKPKSLKEVKTLTDSILDGSPQFGVLRFGLSHMGVAEPAQREIIDRWTKAGSPPLKEFCPYFRYMFGVDLFFDLAIASDQISRVRPAGKADNKVDIAYLYYLPFCHVFTSKDNLHKKIVPLFMHEDQTFVDADDLKADFQKLDAHYSALPEEVKKSGFFKFASSPPEDTSFLVTQLWDKHAPGWRKNKARAENEQTNKAEEAKLVAEVNRIREIAEASPPTQSKVPLPADETDFVQILHYPLRRKGKWLRYPDDMC
jgi:hypothetical protein